MASGECALWLYTNHPFSLRICAEPIQSGRDALSSLKLQGKLTWHQSTVNESTMTETLLSKWRQYIDGVRKSTEIRVYVHNRQKKQFSYSNSIQFHRDLV